MGKEGDGALMPGLAGVRMKPLVQRRRSAQHVEQQDQPGQPSGDNRLAASSGMTPADSHDGIQVSTSDGQRKCLLVEPNVAA